MSTDRKGSPPSTDGGAIGTATRISAPGLAAPPAANGVRARSNAGTDGPVVTARSPLRWRRLRPVLRRRPLLVAAVLVVLPTGGAALVSAQQPPTYAAVAEVLYQGMIRDTSEMIERELATQRVLLLDRSAVDDAARAVQLPAKEVIDDLTADVVEGSSVLRLQAEAGDPDVARTLAESLLSDYTSAVQARANSRVTEQQAAVEERLRGLAERLTAIDQRVAAIANEIAARVPITRPPPEPLAAEQRALESEAQVIRQQIANLGEESLRWSIDNPAAGLATAEVLAAPTVLDEPVGPQPLRAAAAGALLGIVLAAVWLVSARRLPPGDRGAVSARP